MVVKVEIRTHDGLGRITKIVSNDKIIASPNLLEPRSVPVFHDTQSVKTENSTSNSHSNISLGYLPALHNFSKLKSEQEVIEALKDHYASELSKFDFITFPLDMASSLRSESHYPAFIAQVSESLGDSGCNFGWIYAEKDAETDWSPLKDFPLVILGDLATIYNNQRQAWRYLVEVDKKFPLTLKYAPAIPPVLFPLFTYLGIDFFDSLYGQYMAQNNIFLDADGLIKVSDIDESFSLCNCPACETKSEFKDVRSWLRQHNQNFTEIIIRKIQYAINQGTLRDLVKKYILIDPTSTALLRIADLDAENNILEKFNPSIKKNTLILTSSSDYIRPEIKMFHQRVKERFVIPDWTKAVLLIPCSARKPYSVSKSHRIMSTAVKNALRGKRHSLLELIVTSPLGVVPRFLERVYPAGMYDIPVTGNWSELEENIVEDLLVTLFSQLPDNIPIVSYLAEPEKSIIKNFSQKYPSYDIHILDVQESETSESDLKLLRTHLWAMKDTLETSNTKNNYEVEYFKAMANYQFGKQAGDILFPPETEIKRRGYELTAFYNNKQLATLKMGHLAITVNAASKLAESQDQYKVFFADAEINGSAVYTPGITRADQQIKPEDDVLVMSDKTGKFLALGKTNLSGFELEHCSYGLGVSLKKKMKARKE